MAIYDEAFIQARYDFELNRKETITNALTMPITVVSALGSLLAIMARSFTYEDVLTWWTFVPLMVADIMAFVVCLIYLARAYHLQTYVSLPMLKDVEFARDKFRELGTYIHALDGQAHDVFEAALRQAIIDGSDENTATNDRRVELLGTARLWLFAVLWITAIAGIPFIADQVLRK